MRVDRALRKNVITKENEIKIANNKQESSGSFKDAMNRKSQEQLKEMIDDIKKKGNLLVITKTYRDVNQYKKMIKDYLTSVLQYMYSMNKDISFWQTQYYIIVETIDEKLEDLTKAFLNNELDNINVASTIDTIQGLIVDIYR